MATVQLYFLGEFRVGIDATPIDHFPTDKVRALLAYLAIESDIAHPRTHLATLFWGELGDSSARANLRKSLFRLRQVLGESADSLLTVNRSSVQFHSAHADVDVGRFEQLAKSDDVAALEGAVDSYNGELLLGVELRDAPSFEDWLHVRREQLHQQALAVLHQLGELYLAQGDHSTAQAVAARQIGMEPWHEAAHRQLMRIYVATGQRSQALAQYEQCLTTLETELGAPPSAETEQLLAAILAEEPAEMRLHHFPPAHTAFIGREQAIEQVILRLSDPGTHLITITGTGGVGKSRLATEAVKRSIGQIGLHDAYFVSLGSVTSQSGLWRVLGERLGVQSQSEDGAASVTESEIVAFVREHVPLIVLDNYEQLLPDARCIETLLSEVPEIRLLVTSRVPLNLGAEWRLPLEGLAVPPEAVEEIGPYAAVNLLISSGQRSDPTLSVTEENRASLGRICRALAGMPLALEMAGSWLSLFSPALLADQIAQNLDMLVTTRQDLPERQRSLRAIFDHTLDQLHSSEREMLIELTVFRDSFTLPAALAVSALAVQSLSTFSDHALLQRSADERFSLHPLLFAFLTEKVQDLPAVRERHAIYYLQQLTATHQTNEAQAAEAIGGDITNVRAAWQWAAAMGNSELLATALIGLHAYYKFRGGYEEGRELFAETANALTPSPFVNRLRLAEADLQQRLGNLTNAVALVEDVLKSDIEESRLPALIALAWLNEQRAEYDDATALLQEARELADPQSREAAEIWSILGSVYSYRGSMEARIDAHKQALSISIGLKDELQSAESHNTLSMIYKDTGAYDEAFDHIQQAITIVKQLDHRERTARFTHRLGMIHARMGALDQAQTHYEEAMEIAQALQHKRLLCSCIGSIGVLAKQRRDYDTALQHYRHAVQLAEQLDDKSLQAVYRGNMGNAYMDLGQYERARSYLARAAEIDRSIGAMSGAARHQGNIGDSFKFQHLYKEAIPYFEDAIPYLRLSGTTYFLCWLLISYAECHWELGDRETAQRANEEGGKIAAEVGREFYQLLSILLAERMQVTDHNWQETIDRLHALREPYDAVEMLAEIDYAVWRISKSPNDRMRAAQSFLQLYEETKRMQYLLRYKHLTDAEEVEEPNQSASSS